MSCKESERRKTSVMSISSPSRGNGPRSGAVVRFRNLSLVSGDDQNQFNPEWDTLKQGKIRLNESDLQKTHFPETHRFASPSQSKLETKPVKKRSANKQIEKKAQRPKTAMDVPDLMSYLRMANGKCQNSPFLSNQLPRLGTGFEQPSLEKTAAYPISSQDDSVLSLRISDVSSKCSDPNNKKMQPLRPLTTQAPKFQTDTSCNLEFVNKEFRYDEEDDGCGNLSEDEIEKNERSPFKILQGQLFHGLVVATISTSDQLKNLIKSVLNLPMAQTLLDNTKLPNIKDLLEVGEKIYKAGVGFAALIIGEGYYIPQDRVYYNGYSFTTFGTLKLAALKFQRNKSSKIRAVIQTPDFDSFALNARRKTVQEPKIFISERKWVLACGCSGNESSGFFEITAPIEAALWGIYSEGPCSGLIFVDIP